MDKIKAAVERFPLADNLAVIKRSAFVMGWDAALSTQSPKYEDVKYRATRFAHQCRVAGVSTSNETIELYDRLYPDESLSSTHPLQQKITELLEVNQGLREALEGVVKSWDSRLHEQEIKKNLNGVEYWSPIASMVDSSAIAAAREALENYK